MEADCNVDCNDATAAISELLPMLSLLKPATVTSLAAGTRPYTATNDAATAALLTAMQQRCSNIAPDRAAVSMLRCDGGSPSLRLATFRRRGINAASPPTHTPCL